MPRAVRAMFSAYQRAEQWAGGHPLATIAGGAAIGTLGSAGLLGLIAYALVIGAATAQLAEEAAFTAILVAGALSFFFLGNLAQGGTFARHENLPPPAAWRYAIVITTLTAIRLPFWWVGIAIGQRAAADLHGPLRAIVWIATLVVAVAVALFPVLWAARSFERIWPSPFRRSWWQLD